MYMVSACRRLLFPPTLRRVMFQEPGTDAHSYSLADFVNFNQQPRGFSVINAPYDADHFIHYRGQPQDPDNDLWPMVRCAG